MHHFLCVYVGACSVALHCVHACVCLQGEPSPPRTTRILVAHIPPSISEAQFKGCFEGFAKLQDAYVFVYTYLQGEPSPPRTTRIFVARIPPSVSEAQFKGYFEGFGKLQDAYMPRDHAKQVCTLFLLFFLVLSCALMSRCGHVLCTVVFFLSFCVLCSSPVQMSSCAHVLHCPSFFL